MYLKCIMFFAIIIHLVFVLVTLKHTLFGQH